jgi:hypothetical protein
VLPATAAELAAGTSFPAQLRVITASASGRVDADLSDLVLVLFHQQRKGVVHLKIPM